MRKPESDRGVMVTRRKWKEMGITEFKPTIDKDGLPRCCAECPAFRSCDSISFPHDCTVDNRVTHIGGLCEPALRKMVTDSKPANDVRKWLCSAPASVRQLADSIHVRNFILDQRKLSFQMQGMYDGSMSEACRSQFKSDYEVLTVIAEELNRRVV